MRHNVSHASLLIIRLSVLVAYALINISNNEQNIKVEKFMNQQPTQNIANIQSIQQVLDLKPKIPDYQRPYKWQKHHVSQLFNDLLLHFEQGKQYRIGTVVFHQHDNNHVKKNDIVDGQQRLITLSLLLNALGVKSSSLLNEKLQHSVSQNNIVQNHRFIQSLLKDNVQIDKNKFTQYILGEDGEAGCEMVCVKLDNLDQAFQFFDTQNARGKPLEAYDLLKAYHLREMHSKSASIVHDCVANWESAALAEESTPNLFKIINLVLFRVRRWHHTQSAEQFTSQELDIFKGVSEAIDYPYLRSAQAAQVIFQIASQNPMLYHPRFLQPGFQTNQTLINGEWFFQYIEHYRQLYTELFHPKKGYLARIRQLGSVDLEKNLIGFLNAYKHNGRAGDQYLRELYECTILAYFDKFGTTQLDKFIYKAFVWVYQKRLEWQRITFNTIDNIAIGLDSLLVCIDQALEPKAVMQFMNQPLTEVRFENVDDKFKEIFGVNNDK